MSERARIVWMWNVEKVWKYICFISSLRSVHARIVQNKRTFPVIFLRFSSQNKKLQRRWLAISPSRNIKRRTRKKRVYGFGIFSLYMSYVLHFSRPQDRENICAHTITQKYFHPIRMCWEISSQFYFDLSSVVFNILYFFFLLNNFHSFLYFIVVVSPLAGLFSCLASVCCCVLLSFCSLSRNFTNEILCLVAHHIYKKKQHWFLFKKRFPDDQKVGILCAELWISLFSFFSALFFESVWRHRIHVRRLFV